jgi:signal transduction histidine kinase/CheY-like chemotaxis protein/HPt (histidine-containing phosphotransfer) domain-containing protein
VIFLAMLPPLAFIVHTGVESRTQAMREAENRGSGILRAIAQKYCLLTETSRTLLATLAQLDAFRDKDAAEGAALLRNLLTRHTDYTNLLLIDRQGRVLASARPMPRPTRLADVSSLREAAHSRSFVIGGLRPDPVTGEKVFSCLLPVLNPSAGEIRHYLMVSVKPAVDMRDFPADGLPQHARIYMRDRSGQSACIYPPGPSGADSAAEEEAWREAAAADDLSESSLLNIHGREYLLQYRRLTAPGLREPYMTAALLLPAADAFAASGAILIRSLSVLALSMVLSFSLAFLLGNRVLARPVSLLAEAARSLAGGNLAARSALRGFRGETGLLGKAFDEMAASLEARGRELVTATQSANAAGKAKSEFLANISHEIRTPMNAVIGTAYLALKSDLSAKPRAYVAKIYGAADTLLDIINDLLDFSLIEAGQLVMECREFKLEDLLRDIAGLISQRAEEKNLEVLFGVDANVPVSLVGDPLRLGQALTKILNNAVKFTEKGEVITSCTLDAVLGESIRLRFMIKDTGIGMTKEQQGKLFTAFTQADGSITRRFGGTGLGLIITKRLLELMGGSISIVSEQGRGTSVIFTAVFGLPPLAARGEGRERGRISARILVVDGNASGRDILRSMLLNLHFQADCAASPAEAFALIRRTDAAGNPYRVVIMDWRTPEMDGIEATYRLFSEVPLHRKPAVLILTDRGRSEIEEQAKKAGAAGVLYRPLNKSTLFDSLAEILHGDSRIFPHTDSGSASRTDPESPSLKGLSLLLVEDNPINQQVARELLQSAGAQVTVAENGRTGVDIIRATAGIPPFDLVLMDLQMPEMDGFEATRIIRSHDIYDSMPIVAMTAHAMLEDRQKCLDAGMNDHIAKPIEIDKFFATLLRWVRPLSPRITLGRRSAAAESPQMTAASPPASTREGSLYLPGLDTEKALARLGNNERLFIKLLRQFLAYHDNTETDFYSALDTGDTVGAQRIAHTLKGVAAAIGATALSNEAADLEASFLHGEQDKARVLAPQCFASLRKVHALLKDAFAASDPEKPAPTTGAAELSAEEKVRLTELLDTLAGYLNEFDAEAVSFATARQTSLASLLPADDLENLLQQLARFDFDGALETVAKLRQRAQ